MKKDVQFISLLDEEGFPIGEVRSERELMLKYPVRYLWITQKLRDLGVPSHIKGFGYVRVGVCLGVQYPELLQKMTKGFYPSVAAYYGTNGSRVERSIRHATCRALDVPGNYDKLMLLVGSTIGSDMSLVNSQFIASLVDECTIVEVIGKETVEELRRKFMELDKS